MDLTYLYHRRGIESFLAENAACRRSREVHRAFARAYTGRIARARNDQPLEAA